MTASIQDTLDIGFSRIDRQLTELKEVGALHTAQLTSIERKMEAGFQQVKAELGGLKAEITTLTSDVGGLPTDVGTIKGGSIRSELADLRALIVERLPKTST